MRILQVTPTYPPAWSYGGITKMVYEISKELSRRGRYVEVWTSDALDRHRRVKENYDSKSIKVIRFKNLSFALTRTFYDLHITPSIAFFAKNNLHYFDVAHLHGIRTFQSFAVFPFLKRYNTPYVLQAHGLLYKVNPKEPLHRALYNSYNVLFGRILLKNATKVIALNRVEAEEYRRVDVPEEKIAIIPNGIDLSEYANLPPKGSFKKKFNIPEDKKIILYLGRVHKTKGIDFLIRAYAHLINEMKCRDTILVIAGPDDGYLNDAKALANSLGLYDSVMFTGFISSEDKLKALVDAEVFVTPSFYGFPMTFLEACAIGTPIVTTSLGDTLEWIDGNVGYVTQPTPCNLAEAICRIISDSRLRRRFSKNCIEIVKSEFSIEKVVEKLEKVYEEAVRR
jgi:glycosyltransferase involved in cell wall biosynthesis